MPPKFKVKGKQIDSDIQDYIDSGIIESGTNDNGSWIKFRNGIMVQWGIAFAYSTAAAYGTGSYDYPLPFYEPPAFTFALFEHYEGVSYARQIGVNSRADSIETKKTRYGIGFFIDNGGPYTLALRCGWQAIGRWKA